MLAEQLIDVEARADVLGGIDRADLDGVAPVAGIDLTQVLGAGRIDQRAGDRVAGDAATEAVDPPGQLFLVALAQKVDVGDDAVGVARILLLGADAGQQPVLADPDLDLAANLARERNRRIEVAAAFLQPLAVEGNHAARTGNLQHHPDRGLGVQLRGIGASIGGRAQRLRRAETAPGHFRHSVREPLLLLAQT